MKAFLKKIEVPKFDENMRWHRIKMLFAESEESGELYYFETTLEAQFCTNDEYDREEGMSEELFKEKVNYANSFVGKTFEINLYKFTVKEMTENKYVAFMFINEGYFGYNSTIITDYHIASYMTKEDVILNMKHLVTMRGFNGAAKGVLPDDSTENITTELFFPKPIPEKKHFEIPYDRFPNLTASYIINEISIKDIRKGCNLAYQIKERDIPQYDFTKYIHQIEVYRSKARTVKAANESLRKKIFFWEPKEVIEELKLNSAIISLFKDCIILGSLYPSDCEYADKEHAAECERRLRTQFMHENVDKTNFREKWIEFRRTLGKKYSGMSVIKVID